MRSYFELDYFVHTLLQHSEWNKLFVIFRWLIVTGLSDVSIDLHS